MFYSAKGKIPRINYLDHYEYLVRISVHLFRCHVADRKYVCPGRSSYPRLSGPFKHMSTPDCHMNGKLKNYFDDIQIVFCQ